MERILRNYWVHLLVVARVGCYYGTLFQGYREFTQWYPLSPTIFNIVLNTVTCRWISIVAKEEAGPEGFRWAVQWLVALFYADNGILYSPQLDRLQADLDVLAGIFHQVCMHNNVTKMVGIV